MPSLCSEIITISWWSLHINYVYILTYVHFRFCLTCCSAGFYWTKREVTDTQPRMLQINFFTSRTFRWIHQCTLNVCPISIVDQFPLNAHREFIKTLKCSNFVSIFDQHQLSIHDFSILCKPKRQEGSTSMFSQLRFCWEETKYLTISWYLMDWGLMRFWVLIGFERKLSGYR